MIKGHEVGGQLSLTTEVENFPGFPEGINGPDLIENMKKQAENAVWGYREPYDEATGLAGHYAFYKSRVDSVEVS